MIERSVHNASFDGQHEVEDIERPSGLPEGYEEAIASAGTARTDLARFNPGHELLTSYPGKSQDVHEINNWTTQANAVLKGPAFEGADIARILGEGGQTEKTPFSQRAFEAMKRNPGKTGAGIGGLVGGAALPGAALLSGMALHPAGLAIAVLAGLLGGAGIGGGGTKLVQSLLNRQQQPTSTQQEAE